MSIIQTTFYKYASVFKVTNCIKRPEKKLARYIEKYYRNYVIIDTKVLLEQLDKIALELSDYDPKHVIIINQKEEFNACLKLFGQLTGFKVKNYKIGMFTNIRLDNFVNAVAVICFHDRRDRSALVAAKSIGIKRYGLSNLSRGFVYFDKFAPINNFSEDSIVLVTWYLTSRLQVINDRIAISLDDYYTLINGKTIGQ